MITYRPMRHIACATSITLVVIGGCSKMSKDNFHVPPEIEHPWKPATKAEVEQAERLLGIQFPDDYGEFLMSVNGIIGESAHLVIPDKDDNPWYIRGIHSIAADAPDYARLLDRQRD